jgi:hypothetical protein
MVAVPDLGADRRDLLADDEIAMLAGFATTYPVNWWLIRSGVKEAMQRAARRRGGRRFCRCLVRWIDDIPSDMAPADPPLTPPAHRFGLLIEEFERGLTEGIRRDQAVLGPLALLLLAYLRRILRGLGTLHARCEAEGSVAPAAPEAAGEGDPAAPSGWTSAGAGPGASPRQAVAAYAGAAARAHDGRRTAAPGVAATAEAVTTGAAIPIPAGAGGRGALARHPACRAAVAGPRASPGPVRPGTPAMQAPFAFRA